MPSSDIEPRANASRPWPNAANTRAQAWLPLRLPGRRRRRSGVMLLGAALAALGGLGVLWLVDSAQHRTAVVVMTHGLEAGTTVAAGDLAEAEVVVPPGVAVVPAAQREALVGKAAQVDLAAGALPAPGSIGDPVPPAAGQSVVVLALSPSRLPASGLRPGERLVLVSTSTSGPADGVGSDAAVAGQTGTAPTVATADAVVVRVGAADPGGTTPVDVAVHLGDGPLWAGLAADGRVTVLVEPDGQVHR